MIRHHTHACLLLTVLSLALLVPFLTPANQVQAATAEEEGIPEPQGHLQIIAGRAYPDPTWWSEHAINQIAPETFNHASEIVSNPFDTCGPATLALIANFYRSDQQAQVTTLQVMRAIQKAGFYKPPNDSGVVDYPALAAVAPKFGLAVDPMVDPFGYQTFTEFLRQIRSARPAIVAMRYHYTPDGRYIPWPDGTGPSNHFVVVFGTLVVNGQEQLWVANTHPGAALQDQKDARPVTMDFETFKAAWMLGGKAGQGQAVFYSKK